jgi:hypothetical protein
MARFYSRDAAAVLYRHSSNQKGSSKENQSSTTQTSKETKTEVKRTETNTQMCRLQQGEIPYGRVKASAAAEADDAFAGL